MGGVITTFEVLRVDEMKNKDKTQAFYFLYRLIDGPGGTRVKQLICSDTSCESQYIQLLHEYLMNFFDLTVSQYTSHFLVFAVYTPAYHFTRMKSPYPFVSRLGIRSGLSHNVQA
jgi:hypothetical protein